MLEVLKVRSITHHTHSLIDQAPWNDATSLTTYTTCVQSWHQNIYLYTLNPVESNHRDGPTGDKKKRIFKGKGLIRDLNDEGWDMDGE